MFDHIQTASNTKVCNRGIPGVTMANASNSYAMQILKTFSPGRDYIYYGDFGNNWGDS